jgi:copper(I)-binding protein
VNPVRRQHLAVLAAVSALALALTGCGSIRTQTQQWYTPADGASAEAGDIAVRNVVVVADESGEESTVLATFANRGEEEDRLVEVRVGDATATPAGGDLTIPAGSYATLGPGETRVDVEGADTVPGTFVEVEFRFESAPRTTVDALVQAADGEYEDALIAPREASPTP